VTKTVVAEAYGGPEVLVLQDVELPAPGEGKVLVDVRAAGANPLDYKLYSGDMGSDPARLPMPIGLEAAGVVVAVAPGVAGYTGPLTVGDAVIVTGISGGYAERVVAGAADVGHKPESLSFEQAAGLLLVGGTAWHLLTNTRVGTGDTVLIHGASGGVGLMAVQLAVARGAKVIATASPARHDQLRGYGAEPVAYGEGLADRVRAIGTVDAALDLVGTDEALLTSVELVADRAGHRGPHRGRRRSADPRRLPPRTHRPRGAGEVGRDRGSELSTRRGGRGASLSADRARPRKSRTGSLT
jgi:NADPH:quinone reductase-like Zn-dependent oxidoreductase